MTTVCFVRHARSTYNAEGRMAGFHDPPLSAEGRREAMLTAAHLRETSFAAAYSSPLRRSLETARIVWGGRPAPIAEAPAIRELDMGEFSGQKWNDVLRNFPMVFLDEKISFWQLFAHDRIPGQEPFQTAVERIMGFFSQVAVTHADQTIMVVAHKGVLEVFLSQTIGFDPCFDWFEITGASITVFEISAEKRAKIVTLNQCPGQRPI